VRICVIVSVMGISNEELSQLTDPNKMGVLYIEDFLDSRLLEAVRTELSDSPSVVWNDAHDTYRNQRGLTIIQNHDLFALKLGPVEDLSSGTTPSVAVATNRVHDLVDELAESVPSLAGWRANELSMHRYDVQELGLSTHRDNTRYFGLIAITALVGECAFETKYRHLRSNYHSKEGGIFLMRASGLIDEPGELRPEHGVGRLFTPIRISLMLRHNTKPNEAIDGFEFNNWPQAQNSA
jgi:hypothetical protein